MTLRRAFLSVVVLFQLLVVTIGPNKETYHSYLLAPVLEPMFNALEFGASWSFFAPDPGPAPMRLEWETLDERGGVIGTGVFPEPGYPYRINERQTRRVSIGRFFYFDDNRHLNVWGSWLCRSNPGAYGFRLWKAMGEIPNLFKVQSGEMRIEDGATFPDRTSVGSVYCADLRKENG